MKLVRATVSKLELAGVETALKRTFGQGSAPAYDPDVTKAFLEYAVKDAKEEGQSYEELSKNRGNIGSIITNKAKAFLGRNGYTFESTKKKEQLNRFLVRTAKPYIKEALEEEALEEEAVDGEAEF